MIAAMIDVVRNRKFLLRCALPMFVAGYLFGSIYTHYLDALGTGCISVVMPK
jgi:hypothetical protein